MSDTARQGFLLTRHWRDADNHGDGIGGVEVELWLAADDGPCRLRLPAAEAVAFVPAEQAAAAVKSLLQPERGVELRPLALYDFRWRPVLGLYCRHYRHLLRLEKRLREHGIDVYEADIRPPERYLMERFITAPVAFTGTPAPGDPRLLLAVHVKPAPGYRPRPRTVSLDIESTMQGELRSIGMEGCGQRQVYMLGSAIPKRRLDPLPDDDRRSRTDGSLAFADRLRTLPGKAAGTRRRRHLPFVGNSFARLTSPQGALF
jgi:DNA polymerase-2